MTLEDLQYIFQPQIDEGTTSLYFILKDSVEHKSGIVGTVIRHEVDDLESLLPMLDSFQYAGTQDRMPRFEK